MSFKAYSPPKPTMLLVPSHQWTRQLAASRGENASSGLQGVVCFSKIS
jgi:hypothetical protein